LFLNLIFKYVKGQTLGSFLVGILPYPNVITRSFSRMIQDEHKFPVDFKLFREAAIQGIEKGFVKYVLYQKPEKIPSFLKHL
jgi:hypothetical protein